jgi:hypothetical protein
MVIAHHNCDTQSSVLPTDFGGKNYLSCSVSNPPGARLYPPTAVPMSRPRPKVTPAASSPKHS